MALHTHRAYHPDTDTYVYWGAPVFDDKGNYYPGPITFTELTSIVIIRRGVSSSGTSPSDASRILPGVT